uniref:Putative ovule protein n=1 Tax=Solanum chacoense TaxID=4108 RepID=A0A0V0H8A8_SOLCH
MQVANFHNKLSKNQIITQELGPKLTTGLHPIETKIWGKGVRKIRKSKSEKSKQKSEKIKLRIFNFVQLTKLMKICNATRGTKSNV